MMALEGAPGGFRGAYITARDVVRYDGLRGLYKGFGTVLTGLIPARMLYLATLEATKSGVQSMLRYYPQVSDTFVASSSSFIAGGAASLAGQLVIVPIDVVSQRLMIMGGGQAGASIGVPASVIHVREPGGRVNGIQLARHIIHTEGVFRGLYRGFGASVVTFVPSSAIWWASYGAWQSVLWHQVDKVAMFRPEGAVERSSGSILGVQVVAGILTGCTSASLTNPLDVIKTRIQTAKAHPTDGSAPSWRTVAADLLRSEGPRGFFRGLVPRMTSTAIWGTAMVTTYEFLKRMCILPGDDDKDVNASVVLGTGHS